MVDNSGLEMEFVLRNEVVSTCLLQTQKENLCYISNVCLESHKALMETIYLEKEEKKI